MLLLAIFLALSAESLFTFKPIHLYVEDVSISEYRPVRFMHVNACPQRSQWRPQIRRPSMGSKDWHILPAV